MYLNGELTESFASLSGIKFGRVTITARTLIWGSIVSVIFLLGIFLLDSIQEYAICGWIPGYVVDFTCYKYAHYLLVIGEVLLGVLTLVLIYLLCVKNTWLFKRMYVRLAMFFPVAILMFLFGLFASVFSDRLTPMLWLIVYFAVVIVLATAWSASFLKQRRWFWTLFLLIPLVTYIALLGESQVDRYLRVEIRNFVAAHDPAVCKKAIFSALVNSCVTEIAKETGDINTCQILIARMRASCREAVSSRIILTQSAKDAQNGTVTFVVGGNDISFVKNISTDGGWKINNLLIGQITVSNQQGVVALIENNSLGSMAGYYFVVKTFDGTISTSRFLGYEYPFIDRLQIGENGTAVLSMHKDKRDRVGRYRIWAANGEIGEVNDNGN